MGIDLKRLVREPLVHFLLLGAGLFVVYGAMGRRLGAERETILVSRGRIEQLAAGFARAWQRPPTDQELEGVIEDYLREEVYAREAVRLGLDQDDPIIRRRLRQKMEFLTEDLANDVEPSDEQLRAYFAEHPGSFRIEPRFSFHHVFVNPEGHGDDLAADIADLRARLTRAGDGPEISELGDPFLLGSFFEGLAESEVVAQFGPPFAAELATRSPRRWEGPVGSGFGVHFVFVTARSEGRIPALDEVRDAVHREWAHARRLAANETYYRQLLRRYAVTVERQPSAGDSVHLVAARDEP